MKTFEKILIIFVLTVSGMTFAAPRAKGDCPNLSNNYQGEYSLVPIGATPSNPPADCTGLGLDTAVGIYCAARLASIGSFPNSGQIQVQVNRFTDIDDPDRLLTTPNIPGSKDKVVGNNDTFICIYGLQPGDPGFGASSIGFTENSAPSTLEQFFDY